MSKGGIDTSPVGRLVFHLMGAIDEWSTVPA